MIPPFAWADAMDAHFEQAKTFFLDGVAHYEQGRYEAAMRSFEASLSLVPGRPSTLTNLGAARLKLGLFDAALEALQEALEKEPDNVEALGHHGAALAELGRPEDALRSFERLLQVKPDHASAWTLRGNALRDLGRPEEAAHCFEQAIAHGGDAELNGYYLASITQRDAPPTAPRGYVEALFDNYADGFDEQLIQTLRYRAPQVLTAPLKDLQTRFERATDLGCGTGLCGPLVRPLVGWLEGVDLSAGMLERAAQLNVYDKLVQGDVIEYLQQANDTFDLVLAADVFVYIGALEQVFAAVAGSMRPGGIFCFSVESSQDEDVVLRESLRYAHAEGYILGLAAQHGFTVVQTEHRPLREDQRVPIPACCYWLRSAPTGLS